LLGLSLDTLIYLKIFSYIVNYSNHGGRQVDTAPPAIECLEEIVNVVDGRAEGKFDLIEI
jgi:isopentenyl diphosphate isomerase/L-lactate dehydrogenase-like FMN-dependent dehydrogenase